jgi:hypothetical protein
MSRNFLNAEEEKQKRLAKTVNTHDVQVGNMLCHRTETAGVSNDPTKSKVTPDLLMQRKALEGHAKVYSARRNESNITF